MEISYFYGVTHKTPIFKDVDDIFDEIKNGDHREIIDTCRKALDSGDKDKYSLLKKKLPCYTISCRTTERRAETLEEYSGLMQGDLDNLSGDVEILRDQLFKDPHVEAAFVSPSGRGVKLWIKVVQDATKHKESFLAAEQHFKSKHNINLDPACKDMARLFFQSFDPDAKRKNNAVPIPLLDKEEPLFDKTPVEEATTYRLEDYERAVEALKQIPPEEYQVWQECAMALKDGLGEKGYELFVEWSKKSDKCKPSELKYKWGSFDKEWKGERITFSTLFYHAQDPCTHKTLDTPPVRQRDSEAVTLSAAYHTPPGFVGSFASFLTQHSKYKQPIIALASSLCFAGTLMGQKYRTEENTRTNLFLAVLAPTGSGKQFPRDVIKQFDHTHDLKMFGSEKVTSRAAIERLMTWRPSCLFLIDEFGMYLKQLMATTTGYQADIIQTLMEVFTSCTGPYYPLDRATQEEDRFFIDQPCLSVLGTATPETFWEGLNTSKIRDGSLNRFLIFQTPNKRPERHRPEIIRKFPPTLIDKALQFRDTPTSSSPGNVQGHPDPQVIYYSDEAFIRFENLEDECTKLIDAQSVTSSMWVRVVEYAKKIALIVAVGDGKKEIEFDHAEYGCGLVKQLTEQTIISINQNLSDNQNERVSKKVERLIRDAGKAGISSTILTQRTRYLNNARHRKEILSDLQDSGLVVCVKTKADNTYKPVERWHYVG
jgi:hypothetical protein